LPIFEVSGVGDVFDSAHGFSFITHQSSIVNHQSSIINHQSSIINRHSPLSVPASLLDGLKTKEQTPIEKNA
jgi:hypothetical protein